MNDKRVQFIYNIIDTIFSLIRLVVQISFLKRTHKIKKNYDRCIILGNGPSLKKSLLNYKQGAANFDLVAVNFMALSDEFIEYRPNVYILCDPAFWFEEGTQKSTLEKVNLFYETVLKVTNWEMKIFLPWQAQKSKRIKEIIKKNKNLSFHFYNKTKVEGFSFINYFVYNRQWGMPRPQNVLIASLMLTLYFDYKEIYLIGAENNWLKNIVVDNQNKVTDEFSHFYKDGKRGDRTNWGDGAKLHNVLLTLHHVFKSYVEVESYARKSKKRIYNSTPESYIDAFERKPIL